MIALVLVALAGCQPGRDDSIKKDQQPVPPAADVKDRGVIKGRVLWEGEIPAAPSLRLTGIHPGVKPEQPNPNSPIIDPKSNGVEHALVFPRIVESLQKDAWPHPQVRVIFQEGRLDVVQGERKGRVGIVRQGDEFVCLSREKRNQILAGRGPHFFSLPLFDADKETRRRLDKPGTVELSSGAGAYWLRGHLFVAEHPYVAVTASDGTFQLPTAPAGKYELVCWLPSWHIRRTERNPETGDVERLIFEDAVEQNQEVRVVAGETVDASFRWSAARFVTKK